MKKLIILFVLIFPMLGKSVDYVTGCRADINLDVDSVSIPLSIYTNGLVAWFDFSSGALGTGTTNFLVAGFSTNRLNMTQPVINSQPLVVSNQYVFGDGVDDKLLVSTPSLSNVTYAILLKFPDAQVTSRKAIFGGNSDANYYKRDSAQFLIPADGVSNAILWRGGTATNIGGAQALFYFSTNHYGTWQWIVFRESSTSVKKINTLLSSSSQSSTPLEYATNVEFLLYAYVVSYSYSDLPVASFLVWDRFLTDDETTAVLNLRKPQ